MSFVVETLIKDLRNGMNGEMTDKTRVIDHLLDIRLAAVGRPALVDEVDRLLADVPGLTMVENLWFCAALDDLSRIAAAVPSV